MAEQARPLLDVRRKLAHADFKRGSKARPCRARTRATQALALQISGRRPDDRVGGADEYWEGADLGHERAGANLEHEGSLLDFGSVTASPRQRIDFQLHSQTRRRYDETGTAELHAGDDGLLAPACASVADVFTQKPVLAAFRRCLRRLDLSARDTTCFYGRANPGIERNSSLSRP